MLRFASGLPWVTWLSVPHNATLKQRSKTVALKWRTRSNTLRVSISVCVRVCVVHLRNGRHEQRHSYVRNWSCAPPFSFWPRDASRERSTRHPPCKGASSESLCSCSNLWWDLWSRRASVSATALENRTFEYDQKGWLASPIRCNGSALRYL